MTNNIYAGIGSRQTPKNILDLMILIGQGMAKEGHILRSGGAAGADSAFEKGCDLAQGSKEIYLPWHNFNGKASRYDSVSSEAMLMTSKYHPAWDRCGDAAKKLHSRNAYQVLGWTLDKPAEYIICYTNGTGGTQQALRMAEAYNIKIFNLFEKSVEQRFVKAFTG